MTDLAALPVTSLKGVGSKVAEKLAKIGVDSVQDLLFHLPLRYEDRTRIWTIASLMPGIHGTVEGEILSANVTYGRKRMMTVKILDASGSLTLRFFNFAMAQKNSLQPGKRLRAFGEARRGLHGLEIIHPEYSLLEDDSAPLLEESLTPIYPTTEGLKQLSLRKLCEQAVDHLRRHPVPELLPEGLYDQQMSMAQALHYVHRPPADANVDLLTEGQHPAQQRLAMEELLAQNLSMLQLRQSADQHTALPQQVDRAVERDFLNQLPFTPTGAQQRVVGEIRSDLAQTQPMMRLVQGDVGSGKTLVAALAALTVLSQGQQVALMAPTELLAEQHALAFAAWLEPLGFPVAWLAGKLKGKAREQTLARVADGSAKMIVGTHAIFQDQVRFDHLSLIIIDEQHRFGVHQRLELREKGFKDGNYPHQLIMTATPIPRTLAMTAYADLDTSVIDELPPGRTPVTTVAVGDSRRPEVVERVRQACKEQGRQAYWVCTLIDESEVLQCQAAEDTAQELGEQLPDLRVGLVHGRMKSSEKQQVMDQFKSGELDLLVATTVIEVGVDVPNASLMIIENPERLGLAQLHQLRGRVGRGCTASHCVLLYHPPLSKTAQARIGVLRESNDGFIIAQRDLEIRGPGEVLGTKQTGLADLKIADLIRDGALIPQVKRLALHLMRNYPQNVQPLIDRWLKGREIYSQA
ncbi:ATP-dependent DNA helicase RecG [Ferrimonas sp. SCSIO 43195]|uniref:ATP-dependent DNA helicase RecG n=1 Tax=Ferrimonas sp. SCSIO 43195 TaxID=2822844 RepID=UPI002074F51A|nr:ATP-dependent DNA helicase RecG [Ferrimonas sp. SCSIO 43195]USD37698.1 ATP-dependent DNA helicase RecG [Ferrimonas sp. SCSIO 43195]